MKEIIAIIRMNMVNKTKEALLKAGYPSITCRKVMGRGKKKLEYDLIIDALKASTIEDSPVLAEQLSEGHRLISKRMLILIVEDSDYKEVVDTILEVNKTGNAGDGKIFVSQVAEAIRVRTGERGIEAI